MSIPAEHTDLFNSLCERLEQIHTEISLAGFMGTALKSLLRRQGDVPFLEAIRDAYVARAAGSPLPDQRLLARNILQIVLQLRPEIAKAWQDAQQKSEAAPKWTQPDRRTAAVDHKRPAPTHKNKLPLQAESIVADFMRTAIERRLACFNLTQPEIPSAAYYHEHPFFLFDRKFHKVLSKFVTEILMPLCQPVLSRTVYTELNAHLDEAVDVQNQYLLKKRPEIEKALIQRLSALAVLQTAAENIIHQAEQSDGSGPLWKTIKVPQSRPRAMSILGVKFAIGKETVTRTITIRADGGRDLTAEEMQALTLYTQFSDMAASEGIELPAGCDFKFLCVLLDFDQIKFSQSSKLISELAGHNLTSSDFLINKLRREERIQTNGLADVLLLSLFNDASERGFGIADLHRFCIETSREPADLLKKRPFLYWEVARRPFELAFQIRHIMQKRLPVNTLEVAIRMLFTAWRILARSLFAKEMDIALGVISSFPIIFAGESNEAFFTKMAEDLVHVLKAVEPDYERAMLTITTTYAQALKAHV